MIVATDVASRGLDIPGVDIVFHYRLPNEKVLLVVIMLVAVVFYFYCCWYFCYCLLIVVIWWLVLVVFVGVGCSYCWCVFSVVFVGRCRCFGCCWFLLLVVGWLSGVVVVALGVFKRSAPLIVDWFVNHGGVIDGQSMERASAITMPVCHTLHHFFYFCKYKRVSAENESDTENRGADRYLGKQCQSSFHFYSQPSLRPSL